MYKESWYYFSQLHLNLYLKIRSLAFKTYIMWKVHSFGNNDFFYSHLMREFV